MIFSILLSRLMTKYYSFPPALVRGLHKDIGGGYNEHHGECRQNWCTQGHWECVLVEYHGTVEEEVEQSALNFEVRGGNPSAGRMSLGH